MILNDSDRAQIKAQLAQLGMAEATREEKGLYVEVQARGIRFHVWARVNATAQQAA